MYALETGPIVFMLFYFIQTVIPIVVTACNRPSVSRCLDRIFEIRGRKKTQFPVIVSQDCGDQATADVLHGYGDKVCLYDLSLWVMVFKLLTSVILYSIV